MLRCNKGGGRVKSATVVIKKYENRRLYDTSASRYINLEDIAALVRNGTEVKVVDAKSGEDLTRVTLTQIIVEEAKEQPAALPLEFLRQMILASDKVRRDFMSWYLKSAFDSYHNLQSAVQSGLSQVGSVALSPLESLGRILNPQTGGRGQESDELNELRERVAQLEAMLREKEAKRKSASRKRTAAKR
jgi:polyhydroxyalkanoate synthesis repressor PhaR